MNRAELLTKLALNIALEMSFLDTPNIWRVKDNKSEYSIRIYKAGAWLFLRLDNGRIEICTTNPAEMPSQYSRDSMTVNANRDPESIAKDIIRKILPSAELCFIQGREQAKKEAVNKQATAETVHKIARYFGGNKKHYNGDRATDLYGTRARVQIHDGKIEEMRTEKLTTEEAIQIFEILYKEKTNNE